MLFSSRKKEENNVGNCFKIKTINKELTKKSGAEPEISLP